MRPSHSSPLTILHAALKEALRWNRVVRNVAGAATLCVNDGIEGVFGTRSSALLEPLASARQTLSEFSTLLKAANQASLRCRQSISSIASSISARNTLVYAAVKLTSPLWMLRDA